MTRLADLMKQASPLMPVARYAEPLDVGTLVHMVGELRSN